MKNKWLLLALCCIGSILFAEQKIMILVLVVFYWLRSRDKTVLFCVFLIASIQLLLLLPKEPPKLQSGRVVEIKSNSIILKVGNQKVIGMNFDGVSLDQIVSFRGEYELIQSSPSTYGFNYESWCRSKGIVYSIYAWEYEIEKDYHSVQSHLYNKLKESDEPLRSFLLKVLYSIDEQSVGSLDELLIYSGTHISSFFTMLEQLLSMFFTHAEIFTLVLLGFSGCVFRFKFIYRRLILKKLLCKTRLDHADRLGVTMIILILLEPRCIYSPSFIFPMLLSFMRCFDLHKNRLTGILSLMIVQLALSYEVNLFQIFAFPLLKQGIAIVFAAALIALIFPAFQPVCEKLIRVLNSLAGLQTKFLRLSGSLQLPLLIALIFWQCSHRSAWRKNVGAAVFLSAVLLVHINHPFATVSFMNVGQGDSILIRMPFSGGNYLIDTGPAAGYENLRRFLCAQGVNHIDALFITHYDEDHAANIDRLKQDFDVRAIIDHKTDEYTDNGFSIRFLLPEYTDEDKNADSLILYTQINSMSFLFLGDIGAKQEKLLTDTYNNLKADVVKLAHHGSKTSSSEDLLDSIQAKTAVISCGLNNRYHHPSEEVIERLKRYPIAVYSTAEQGDITFILTRFFNLLCTSGKFLI